MLPTNRTRSNDHELKHPKFYLNIEEILYFECDTTLKAAAQRGRTICSSTDVQNTPGCCAVYSRELPLEGAKSS